MTFGGGPHLCPGRNISRFVGEIALRRLVHRPERLMLTAGGADWIEGASTAQLRSCIVESR
jgi:cytochrome P450